MPFDDAAYDRQPQPAALRRIVAGRTIAVVHDPIEAVEHTLQRLRRNARTVIADPQPHTAAIGRCQRHLDARGRRIVAQRILEQVADQDTQRIRIALHGGRKTIGRVERHRRTAFARGDRQIGDHGARKRGQVHRRGRLLERAGLLARQGQQLRHQPDRSLQPAAHHREGFAAFVVVAGAFGELDLQLQRGQRRAQFVSGVGDECALRQHRALEPRQQIVQRVREGQDLARQAGLGDRLQALHVARLQLGRHAAHRRQARADHDPHQRTEQRQHQQQRRGGAQRHPRGEVPATGQRLRDLHDGVAQLRAVHPPQAAGRAHVGEAELRPFGQDRLAVREVQPQAAAIPDLNDDVFIDVDQRRPARRHRREGLAGQRGGELPELVVEHLVGLRQRLAIDQRAGERDRRDEAQDQRYDQRAPDRAAAVHVAASGASPSV